MTTNKMDLRGESLGDWLSAYRPRKLIVGPEPEKVQGALIAKNFMVYPIKSQKKVVKRRFSEFEEVRAQLEKRFGCYGLLVPSLPPKAGFGTAEEVVKHRMRALNMFCDRVEGNPFLGTDSAWLEFIGDEKAPPISVGQLRYMQALEKWVEEDSPVDEEKKEEVKNFPVEQRPMQQLFGGVGQLFREMFVPDSLAEEETTVDLEAVKFAVEALAASLGRAASEAEALRDAMEAIPGLSGARDPLDTLSRQQLKPVAEALTVLAGDVASYEQEMNRTLKEMLRKLTDLDRAAASAREREHRFKMTSKEVPREFTSAREQKDRRAKEYRAGLTHWTLPRFRETRDASLEKLWHHTALLASVLGYPSLDDSSEAALKLRKLCESFDAREAVAVLDDLELPRPSALLAVSRSTDIQYLEPTFLTKNNSAFFKLGGATPTKALVEAATTTTQEDKKTPRKSSTDSFAAV